MPVFQRNGDGPDESLPEPAPAARGRVAWFSTALAALTLATLLVFIVQNTGDVDVAFLWLDGTVPLTLALLVAGVGSALVPALIRRGTARPSGSGRHTGRAGPPG